MRFLAALLLLWAGHTQAVTYANSSTPFSWIDASAHTKVGHNTLPYRFSNTGGCGTTQPILDDTLSDSIPLGFTFMFGGTNFNSVRIMTNGRLQFSTTTCGYGSPVTQLPYPNAGLNYSMRIYGNDLDHTAKSEVPAYNTVCLNRASCYISYATLGTAPYRRFVVTWNNVPEWAAGGSTSGNYNLQVILQENGEFIYQYGPITAGPGGATAQIGWQVDTGDYEVPAVGYPASNSAIKFFIPRPVAEYRMEQLSWSGAAGEVLDTSGNARHGTAIAVGASTRPAEVATGRVCRGGQMENNNAAADISAIDTGVSIPATVGGVGTITFWYNNSSNDRMLFDATIAGGQWFYLMRTNNRALRFVVTDSIGVRREAVTANNTIPNNGWTHIAVTWNFNALAAANSDRLRIYVDGVLGATAAFTTAGTVSPGIGTLYIGDNRSSFIDGVATGRSAGNPGGSNATLDEFRIYNYEGGVALVDRDRNQAGACLNHYAITTFGTPTICPPSAAQVTITAHDVGHGLVTMPNNTTQVTLTTSTGRGNWSLVSGYGVLNNGVADDGIATYLFNGEYQAVLAYQPTISGSVNFNITDGQIVESATEDPTLNVAGCASNFNGCEPITPQCTPTAPPALGYAALFTKLAGTAFSLEGVALKADGTLETAFNGNVTVDLLANINTGVPLGANNCPSSQDATIPLGSAAFNAGRTTISSINIANAYRDVRMRYTCAPAECGSAITACSSDNFAVRPQLFTVTANLGGPTLKAGNNFTMTAATAVPAGYTGTPVLNAALVQDHNSAIAGLLNGSFTAATGSSATGTFQYHDVGTISPLANAVTDSGYTIVDQANADCVLGDTSYTLAGGKYGCNIGSAAAGPFGRFYPDHFTYAATLTPACAVGGFTYMDQPALGINLTLTAQSAAPVNATTTRYTAGYAPLGTFTITGDDGGAGVPVTRLSPALPAFNWSNGVYAVTGNRSFTRNASPTPDGPFNNFALIASVTDPDGAALTGTNISNTTMVRFGRMRLRNTHGSELRQLRVPVSAEYWNGSGFVTNGADNCSTVGAVTLNAAPSTCTLTPPLTGVGALLSNGTATLTLGAPNTRGCVDMTVATPAWLQGNWDGVDQLGDSNLYDDNAAARAAFGIYRDRLIYRREVK